MPTEIRNTIREIEKEAEKLIEKARAEAHGILEKANKEARDILSEELLVDNTERDRIISGALEEGGKRIEKSREASADIQAVSSRKIDSFLQSIADQVRGIS